MNKTNNTTIRKIFKLSIYLITALITLCLIAVITGYFLVRGSLPQLSGESQATHLKADVIIERDHLGIPTIRAENRLDIAYALGFLHAQDRFFQMDLMRRATGGELSELFGSAALTMDKERRLHQFRKRNEERYNLMNADEKEMLQVYADGINHGLNSLSVRPFEYLMLQQQPVAWTPQDALMVSIGLFFELQDATGVPNLSRGYMKAFLPESVYRFFAFNGSAWNAAIDGSSLPILSIPKAEDFAYLKTFDAKQEPASSISDILPLGGSNNWAITGKRTADGKALVACDMHLKLSEPNIWYRAAFVYKDADGKEVRIAGATLPGTPCMIIGSNEHVAWGFTNAFIDTTDLILLEKDEKDSNRYLTPQGSLAFQKEIEIINVKGEKPLEFEVQNTIWGPVSPNKLLDQQLAIQWVAYFPNALNLKAIKLENLKSTEEVLEVTKTVGVPVLNLVVGDKEGHIAWTLIGSLPKRQGYDGSVPVSYVDGKNSWLGLQNTNDYPVVKDPENQIVWTANNRVAGKDWKIDLNQEGYLNSIRAYLIKQDLEQQEKATAQDMLDLQLDINGLFLERWQTLLLSVLKGAPKTEQNDQLVASVENWDKKASIDSSGYYWIRRFREVTMQHTLARFLHPCFDAWPDFANINRDFEEPVYLIVSQQPDYLINPAFGSWQNELYAHVQEMLDKDLQGSATIKSTEWGQKTVLNMTHPFSRVVPALGRFLDMPHQSLPGDYYMPRLAGPKAGASQRMVVAPGKEQEGIFHAPGGQSGHPMSAHYSDAHAAWVEGLPTPILPGKTVDTLILRAKK